MLWLPFWATAGLMFDNNLIFFGHSCLLTDLWSLTSFWPFLTIISCHSLGRDSEADLSSYVTKAWGQNPYQMTKSWPKSYTKSWSKSCPQSWPNRDQIVTKSWPNGANKMGMCNWAVGPVLFDLLHWTEFDRSLLDFMIVWLGLFKAYLHAFKPLWTCSSQPQHTVELIFAHHKYQLDQ